MAIDNTDFNAVLTDLGSYYPYRTGSISWTNGEGSVTCANGSTFAFLNQTTADHNIVKAGVLNMGDAIVYFKTSNTELAFGTGKDKIQIQFNNQWFEMAGNYISQKIGDNEVFRQANFKRMDI